MNNVKLFQVLPSSINPKILSAKVAVVTNLKPAKLMGRKSEGMILSAEKMVYLHW